VAAGQVVDLRLSWAPSFGEPPVREDEPTLDKTLASWQSWTALHTSYDGDYPDLVRRSSLVLQGLTYAPSGALVAAATTSLPETMGGDLNFDYRYAWLRDLSLTIRSLWLAACPDEPERLLSWLANSGGHVRGELIQIMYGVEGERDLAEQELEHLHGYRGSSPVRIGNEAWKQEQLDVYGEVLDAAYLLRDQLGDLAPATQQLLVALADRAARSWQQPDAGMWEARDEKRHYTSSKVMCWVALDRALRLAPRLGKDADPEAWEQARAAVRAAILEQAWSETAGAYTGAFGSDDLDASVLLLPVVGFLPADDERMRATIEAVAAGSGDNGLVRRWPDDRSGFLICTYWLVECLVLAGETDRARRWFESATAHANDLGPALRRGRPPAPGSCSATTRRRSPTSASSTPPGVWASPARLPSTTTNKKEQRHDRSTARRQGRADHRIRLRDRTGHRCGVRWRRAPTSSSPTWTTPTAPRTDAQGRGGRRSTGGRRAVRRQPGGRGREALRQRRPDLRHDRHPDEQRGGGRVRHQRGGAVH
jgi:hypothetical protein